MGSNSDATSVAQATIRPKASNSCFPPITNLRFMKMNDIFLTQIRAYLRNNGWRCAASRRLLWEVYLGANRLLDHHPPRHPLR